MGLTKPAGEIAIVHTWIFKDLEERNDFNEFGKTEQGLPLSSA